MKRSWHELLEAELLNGRPELALDAGWRGSREQLRMPVTRNRLRLKGGDAALHMHQHHDGCGNRNRRRRMHHDAERAVVGIRVYLVDVRHLNHGKQGQQEQAHYRSNRQQACLCAAFAAQKCLNSCQSTFPCFIDVPLFQGYTLLDVDRGKWLPIRLARMPPFRSENRLTPAGLHLGRCTTWQLAEKALPSIHRPQDLHWGAKQAAERVLRRRNCLQGPLQGLKPSIDFIGFVGPTEVVPLLQNVRSGHAREYFRSW